MEFASHPYTGVPTLLQRSNGLERHSRLSLLAALWLSGCMVHGGSQDLVPELCNLIDQPMYCRCDSSDLSEDVTDVTCYVGRKLVPDHVVFQSFKRQPTITVVAFSAFGNEYRLDFVPTTALRYTPQIERLKMSQAELRDLKPRSFHNLTRLALLHLDSNEITSLDSEAIADLPRLKKLELGDNKLRRLSAGSLKNLPSLTHLYLERNQLEVIDDGAFEELGALQELELSDNSIEKLTEQSFRGLSHVTRLDLFRNKLTRLEAHVFSAMPQLAELELKYNALSEVDALAFEGLPQLTVLYMSYNRLRVLPAHMFRGAPNLVSVDLSQNQLLTLTWRTVQDLAKIHTESFDMSLTGNKLTCDCRLAWILQLANVTRNAKFRRELRHVKCEFEKPTDAPENMASSKVIRLSLEQLGCADDYRQPVVGDRHLMTTTAATPAPDSSLPSTTGPQGADGDGNQYGDDDLGAAAGDTVYSDQNELGGYREETASMKNDVDLILSQRKALGRDSSASSTRLNTDSAASRSAQHAVAFSFVSLVLWAFTFSCCR
ncbi:uncharacterized protein LOC144136788 isoform X2 [Amblyomma americanum]